MLAQTQNATDFAIPPLDLRAVARRAAIPAALLAAAIAAVLFAQSHVHALGDEVRRVLSVSPGWAGAAVVFECLSIAGYVVLLWLVAGRAAPRVGARESAQITLAGAAATRLLPTAGAGGVALALWSLRRAGLSARAATRTLLAFLVVLYSVFLAAVAISGTALALGLAGNRGPVELSAIPAAAASLIVGACLLLAFRRGRGSRGHVVSDASRTTRLAASAHLVADAVRDALALVRTGDARVVGAAAYWLLDAAVLAAMMHALGSPPAVPVILLAYFVGQAANTLPIPGSVSGGIAGVLIAFGVAPGLAIPAVLAYRTLAVWLPTPLAAASVPALRRTVARWGLQASPDDVDDATSRPRQAPAETRRVLRPAVVAAR